MLARLVASGLVVLAFLPFTAPFSTLTLDDMLGGRASRRGESGTMHASSERTIETPDQASNLLRVDVRPVASSYGDTRLMPSILPPTGSPVSPPDNPGAWPDRTPVNGSAGTRPVTTLRL